MFDDDSDDHDDSALPMRAPPAYPPAPCDAPSWKSNRLTADIVMSICASIAGGTPPSTALAEAGLHYMRQSDVQNYASERDKGGNIDPFWGWMLACMKIARASAVAEAGQTMQALLRHKDGKVRLKAAEVLLRAGAEEFAPTQKVEVEHNHTHKGEVSVAIDINALLVQDKTDIRTLARYAPIDVTAEPVPALPDHGEPTPQARHPLMARRTPTKREG